MQARNAESVFPDPVGAEISVVRPARMCGHPCSCGSVGVPNFRTNHSATTGCAQASESGRDCIPVFYPETTVSPNVRQRRKNQARTTKATKYHKGVFFGLPS